MTKHRTTSLWSRTAQALGKLWNEMVSLPDDDRRRRTAQPAWTDFTRFPPF